MKAVLISIAPLWCTLIDEGKKIVEVRKTKPNLEMPFKCYIYCTKPYTASTDDNFYIYLPPHYTPKRVNGKVIGEFICDSIDHFTKAFFDEQEPRDTEEIGFMLDKSCLTYSELCSYVGFKDFYAWHISNLVIYDNPRTIGEFEKPHDYIDQGYRKRNSLFKKITRPPQSWMYVEEL